MLLISRILGFDTVISVIMKVVSVSVTVTVISGSFDTVIQLQ